MGWSMDWAHGPGPWGGPWTRSIGWSMDPGPCFVYVHFLSMFLFWVKMVRVGVGVGKGGKDLHAILFIKDSQSLRLIFVSLLQFILLYREGVTYQKG